MPMKSNQIVSNSLAEALQDFQLDLAPLLKLGEISEWNGKILKQREEKIREAALTLGGKCIAIKLGKISFFSRSLLKSLDSLLKDGGGKKRGNMAQKSKKF